MAWCVMSRVPLASFDGWVIRIAWFLLAGWLYMAGGWRSTYASNTLTDILIIHAGHGWQHHPCNCHNECHHFGPHCCGGSEVAGCSATALQGAFQLADLYLHPCYRPSCGGTTCDAMPLSCSLTITDLRLSVSRGGMLLQAYLLPALIPWLRHGPFPPLQCCQQLLHV